MQEDQTSKKKSPLLIGAIIVGLILIISLFKKGGGSSNGGSELIERPVADSNSYSREPGNLANVFGWGYNRTSCDLGEDTVIFFLAEDAEIYYTYASNPDKFFGLDLNETKEAEITERQNPDFDVFCGENEINLSFTDSNQQKLYFATLEINGVNLTEKSVEFIYDGGKGYTVIAPHARFLNKSLYVAFMEYGRSDEGLKSKVYVVTQGGGTSPPSIEDKNTNIWNVTQVFEYSAKDSQVLGISLENYDNSLIAFINPPLEGMWLSKLDSSSGKWSDAKKQASIPAFGQLEWQTYLDNNGRLHLVSQDEESKMVYSSLKDGVWKISYIKQSLPANTRAVFEIDGKGVFINRGDGMLRKVTEDGLVGGEVTIDNFNKNERNVYGLRIPAFNHGNDQVQTVWMEDHSGYIYLKYNQFSVDNYLDELGQSSESMKVVVEDLAI